MLYISTSDSGLSVINTQGTVDQSDDMLVTRYHTGSTPAIVNDIKSSYLNNGLLYISTRTSGLYVINTQGTIAPGDDTLVKRYGVGTTPALSSNIVNSSFFESDLLYISSNNGLSVINTQGTVDPSDDTEVTRYRASGSTPELPGTNIEHTFKDNNLLYVSTLDGFVVIDTQGTLSPADDTLALTYDSLSSPALPDEFINNSYLEGDLLYISTDNGLTIIDTQGTTVPGDDTLVESYNTESNPILLGTSNHFFLSDNNIYIPTDSGLSVLTPNVYQTNASYISNPRLIATVPTTSISASWSRATDTNVDLSYRTGTSSAVWQDDFTTTDSYVADQYGYGEDSAWQTVVAEDGVLRLSGEPVLTPEYANFVIVSGLADDYFEAKSRVIIRYRILDASPYVYISVAPDDYESPYISKTARTSEDWQEIIFDAQEPFSNFSIEIYPNPNDGELDATVLEIDYIKVITADSMGKWSPWSSSCPQEECVLPDLTSDTYIQYKLDLETDDTAVTPVVDSIFFGDYHATGTYTSAEESFNESHELLTFGADVTTPAGTDIDFEYTINNGDSWHTINPGDTFPDDTYAQSFQWRATLTTTDDTQTPVITSVTLTSLDTTSSNSGLRLSLKEKVTALGDIHSGFAEVVLREKYPEYFENPNNPVVQQKAMIVLLEEVIKLLRQKFLIESEDTDS